MLTYLPGHTGAADPDVGAIDFGLMQGLGFTWHRVGPGMQLRSSVGSISPVASRGFI